jgi:predicted heme/steroid binding protein
MTNSSASLMSVPIKPMPSSLVETTMALSVDYGLLLNRRELSRFNGRTDELPVLIAYRGRLYDVTGSAPWGGETNWRRYAGRDCTALLRMRHDCDLLLTAIPCVGALED